MMDISIAIGRNVGDEPMSDDQWNNYRHQLTRIITIRRGTIEVSESGVATYGDLLEEHRRIWAKVDDNDILDIRRALRELAGENGQWGVALSYVATEIIRP